MMKQMELWADSDNSHVRRLASEGCRPRLPWAMALPDFKKDSTPILPILEKLKNDESEYVRRSVANNLNDISKDHRDLLVKISRDWLGNNENTNKLIKHACRSLLKQGDKVVLLLFGFTDPCHITLSDFFVHDSVFMGENLSFSFSLYSKERDLGQIRIEYAIDFMKNNGRQARKVFKISEADYSGNSKFVEKNHSFRKISTRTYYPGEHGLTIIVNGVEFASGHFTLKPFF
jgi:3-methyladenine DNA glycosylase AlkC